MATMRVKTTGEVESKKGVDTPNRFIINTRTSNQERFTRICENEELSENEAFEKLLAQYEEPIKYRNRENELQDTIARTSAQLKEQDAAIAVPKKQLEEITSEGTDNANRIAELQSSLEHEQADGNHNAENANALQLRVEELQQLLQQAETERDSLKPKEGDEAIYLPGETMKVLCYVSDGADGNTIILSKREGIVIATVTSVTRECQIVKVHWQAPLVGLVQRYLESV